MFDKNSLHHAYFIEGDKESIIAEIESFLEESLGIAKGAHPDVHYSEHESFGIEESRELQSMQSMRPVMGDKKIFVISAEAMTSEAQNALLKVFEEPTAGTHFFIVSSSRRILLPTLASRLRTMTHVSSKRSALVSEVQAFIKADIKERLAQVAGMIEDKDKVKAEGFLNALVSELRGEGLSEASPARANTIKEVLSMIPYLKDRSPSLKLILERTALLPF